MAVSVLSPVKTQTFIPAFLRADIVLSTSSYSLSSIAVAPSISKSLSKSSDTLSKASSLLCITEEAFLYYSFQFK
jgi:hypothetical protein